MHIHNDELRTCVHEVCLAHIIFVIFSSINMHKKAKTAKQLHFQNIQAKVLINKQHFCIIFNFLFNNNHIKIYNSITISNGLSFTNIFHPGIKLPPLFV